MSTNIKQVMAVSVRKAYFTMGFFGHGDDATVVATYIQSLL